MMNPVPQIKLASSTVVCRRAIALGLAIMLLFSCQASWSAGNEPTADTTVGMEGTWFLAYEGPALEAKAVDDRAPLVLRIVGAPANEQPAGYQLHYIANRAGTYDLRDWLVRADGLPIAGIAPLSIRVVSILPADDDGTLASSPGPALPRFWPYRWLLVAGIAIWFGPLVWHFMRRLQPKSRAASDEPAPQTLADQLRPLIAAAVAGCLDSEDLARLESLLVRHWRHRLALEECTADESLQQMRKHPEAGRLLGQLEEWLYRPPAGEGVDVAAILLPYQDQAALDWFEGDLAAAGSQRRFRSTLPPGR